MRVVVGFAAGSGPDIQARTVSQELGNSLGQQFYVENRLGANGTIAARSVATSKPDGYSLLFTSSSIISTPYIYRNLGYDTLTDLRPIATIGELDGMFMLVDAKSPIKTLAEFLALAKTERVLYGSPGVGNGLHLATEIFAKKAGITLQHVPYKGASEVMTALLGGSVQVMFVTPPSVMGLIKDGRVRPLAFTGTKPFPPTPDVPLMKDMLPGYEPHGIVGHIPRARQDAGRHRRQAQRRNPQGAAGPGGGQHHAARRLHSRQPRRRRGGCVLPQGGHAGRRGREGRGHRAELIALRIPSRNPSPFLDSGSRLARPE